MFKEHYIPDCVNHYLCVEDAFSISFSIPSLSFLRVRPALIFCVTDFIITLLLSFLPLSFVLLVHFSFSTCNWDLRLTAQRQMSSMTSWVVICAVVCCLTLLLIETSK